MIIYTFLQIFLLGEELIGKLRSYRKLERFLNEFRIKARILIPLFLKPLNTPKSGLSNRREVLAKLKANYLL